MQSCQSISTVLGHSSLTRTTNRPLIQKPHNITPAKWENVHDTHVSCNASISVLKKTCIWNLWYHTSWSDKFNEHEIEMLASYPTNPGSPGWPSQFGSRLDSELENRWEDLWKRRRNKMCWCSSAENQGKLYICLCPLVNRSKKATSIISITSGRILQETQQL